MPCGLRGLGACPSMEWHGIGALVGIGFARLPYVVADGGHLI
jgi:hypothetical protein